MGLSLSLSPKAASKVRLAARLKAADLFALPEPEAAALVRDMEKDTLFRRLLGLEGGEPVIRRQRFPRASLSSHFYEMNETLLAEAPSLDVQGFVEERRGAAAIVKSLGPEAFERYFLHQEEPLSREALAVRLGLSPAQVGAVFDFVADFSARAEISGAAAPAALPPAESHTCVGRIEGDSFEGFRMAYFLPHLARGRWRVDRDAWERRKADLPAGERARAAALLRRAEFLNLRADAFHRVLSEALEAERGFLAGGGREGLRVLSQREAGRRLGLSSSTICRVVARRSVQLPWGELLPLADLFPQKKRVLREILTEAGDDFMGRTDLLVQSWLWERHQLKVPRRTVNYWRRRLAHEGRG